MCMICGDPFVILFLLFFPVVICLSVVDDAAYDPSPTIHCTISVNLCVILLLFCLFLNGCCIWFVANDAVYNQWSTIPRTIDHCCIVDVAAMAVSYMPCPLLFCRCHCHCSFLGDWCWLLHCRRGQRCCKHVVKFALLLVDCCVWMKDLPQTMVIWSCSQDYCVESTIDVSS